MSASANGKQVAIVAGASNGSGSNHMSESERLPDSSALRMNAIITDEACIPKVEAGLVERLSHVAQAVARDAFRGFGINE